MYTNAFAFLNPIKMSKYKKNYTDIKKHRKKYKHTDDEDDEDDDDDDEDDDERATLPCFSNI